MLEKFKRYIFFHELVFHMMPQKAANAEQVRLEALLPDLRSRFEANEFKKVLNEGQAAIRLIDWRHDEEAALLTLLFAYADTRNAVPAVMNIETGEYRITEIEETYGGVYSAHLVIDLNPRKNKPVTYSAMLERVPTLTRSILQPFLNSQIKEVSDFIFMRNEGPIKCWPKFETHGLAATNLVEAVQRGKLNSIELVSHEVVDEGLDEIAHIRKHTRSLRLSVEPEVQGQVAIDMINKIKDWGRNNRFHDMKIHYRAATSKNDTITLPTMKMDIGDFFHTRHEVVEVEEELRQFEPAIRSDLVDEMLSYQEDI